MSEHSQLWSEELGAYLVGALEPEEAERMRRHLGECAQCRAEYAELAPVVSMLAAIPAEAVSGDDEDVPAVQPDEAMWERLRARAGFEPDPGAAIVNAGAPVRSDVRRPPLPNQRPATLGGERPRRRNRRPLRPAAAAAISGVLVAAAAAGVFANVHTGGSATVASGTETVSAVNAADGVSGSVQYRAADWGSWVQITLKGVKPGDDCVLYAMDHNGDKAVASSWWAPSTLGESATIPGGVAMQTEDIANFQVTDSGGTVLLTIPAS